MEDRTFTKTRGTLYITGLIVVSQRKKKEAGNMIQRLGESIPCIVSKSPLPPFFWIFKGGGIWRLQKFFRGLRPRTPVFMIWLTNQKRVEINKFSPVNHLQWYKGKSVKKGFFLGILWIFFDWCVVRSWFFYCRKELCWAHLLNILNMVIRRIENFLRVCEKKVLSRKWEFFEG